MSHAYLVTTYNDGPWLSMTLAHLPEDVLVLDTRAFGGNLNAAWNHGIESVLVNHDVVIVCNDDVILRPDTGDLLERELLSLGRGLEHVPDWTTKRLLLLSARHAALNDNRTNEADGELLSAAPPKHQPGPDFACFAVTRNLFEEVGPFDEGFQVYASDNDMHRRIQLAGYEAGAYAPYWHLLNGTIRASAERQAAVHAIFEHDKQAYISKWGGWLGHETVSLFYPALDAPRGSMRR